MAMAALEILTILMLLVGFIVCCKGMKLGNVVYKGGFFFFLFSLLSKLYTITLRYSMDAVLAYLQEKSAMTVGYLVYSLGIPATLLNAIGLVLFVSYLIKGISTINAANKGEGL
jgi:hypothetical protein